MQRREIEQIVDGIPLADTHEHLVEEPGRLRGGDGWWLMDFGVLFSHYICDDLVVAGMPGESLSLLLKADTPPERKWQLLKPWWALAKNTGYGLNVRETLGALFGEGDITDDNWRDIQDRIANLIQPGYYRHVLQDIARIDHCQVNSLETSLFQETTYPDLLLQDIGFVPLSTGIDIEGMKAASGMKAETLDDWHAIIDWCFDTYAPRAVAVKNQSAYGRELNYEQVDKADAAPLFARLARGEALSAAERKALEDHLFHHCVERATAHRLPIKLHTGYYAGVAHMPLHRLRHNAGDLSRLLAAHPNARFVIMHVTYPYQSEAVALAKHWPNAYIDMCWAWIISPAAGVRFLKEFLTAAPSNKVFTFGGDYGPVEMVPGHARIARRGVARAVWELVDEGWLRADDVPALLERLLLRNALEMFDVERCRKA